MPTVVAFYALPLLDAEGIMFSGCPSVRMYVPKVCEHNNFQST